MCADTDDIWQRHNVVIRDLYGKERKTLREVKHIMETEYGFPDLP